MPSSGYAQLSRKELQALAKQRGVAANKTSAFLCDELARLDAGRENLPAQNAATETTACNGIGSLARPPPKLPPKPPGAKLSERAPRRLHPSPPPTTEPSTVAASTVATSTVATTTVATSIPTASTVAASTVTSERAPRRRHAASHAAEEGRVNPAGDGEGQVDPAGEGEVAMNFLSVRRSSKTNTQRTAAVKAAGAAVPAKAAAPAAKAQAPKAAAHAAAAAAEARQEVAAAAALRPGASEGSLASTQGRASTVTEAKPTAVATHALEAPTAQGAQAVPKSAALTAAVRKEAAPTAPNAQRRKFSQAVPPPSALCAALEQLLCNHASLFRGAAATLLKVVTNLRLHPRDDAYRALRCSTKAFQSALEPARGAVACLVAIGFVYDQGGDAGGRYALGDAADPSLLAEAEERLRALPHEYEQRAARQEEEAARSLEALRMVSKLNRQTKDARVRQLVKSGPMLAPQLGSQTSPEVPAGCWDAPRTQEEGPSRAGSMRAVAPPFSSCQILSCLLVQQLGAGRAQEARRADPRGSRGPHQPRGGSCMPLRLEKTLDTHSDA